MARFNIFGNRKQKNLSKFVTYIIIVHKNQLTQLQICFGIKTLHSAQARNQLVLTENWCKIVFLTLVKQWSIL